MDEITVVVVDDHPLFRQGVVEALSMESDIEVIGEASNGSEAMAIIQALRPNVAIVDVNLPGINGQQVARNVVSGKIPTHVVLLTGYDNLEQAIHAMRAGAAGYCSKDVQPNHLMDVVRKISAGMFVIGERFDALSELQEWLRDQMESSPRLFPDMGEPYHPLSSREMEVLGCVTKGMSNKEIATSLGISHQTVKNHVTARIPASSKPP